MCVLLQSVLLLRSSVNVCGQTKTTACATVWSYTPVSRPSQWASTGWHWSGEEGWGIRRGEGRAPNGGVKGVAVEMCLRVVRVLIGLQSRRARCGVGL